MTGPGFSIGVVPPSRGAEGRSFDVVVAGGGPAGISAALYLSRYALGHVVLEGWQPGGQAVMTDHIENYPGTGATTGQELMDAMRAQAVSSGSTFLSERVVSCSARPEGGLSIEADAGPVTARALIIATGAAPARLGVPGESRFYGRGVSNCATCDAPLFRGRHVLVVGGGDSAVKEALHLTSFASRITLVHRRDALRAEPALANRLLASSSVEVMWSSRLLEIRGEREVESVVLDTPGGRSELAVDGVFIFVGRTPATDPFRNLVRLNDDGTVWTRDIVCTTRDDVFAAGDVTSNPLRQVVTAAADGARAAAAAWHRLGLEG
ncbi:MAG: FAD-dependent oxidoreductase [Candidatus Fermentibacter sp.]|nr:FAD-dependent oxidoreductase [Candidatus Fermentibacter sp.]